MIDVKLASLVLAIYLVLMLLIGVYEYRKTRGLLDFYLAGRRLGALVVSFSFFATYFSTAAFLGGGGFGFIAGFQWSAFLTFFHILFALLAWMFIAPKMRELAHAQKVLTISEIFRNKYGIPSQVLAALIILFFFEFYMVSIYKGAGNLLQVMLSMDYKAALLITGVVVMIYTAIGGFRAVVMTDLIQGLLILVGGVALFITLILTLGGLSNAIQSLSNVKLFAGMTGSSLFELGKLSPPPIMKAGMVLPFILSLTFAISVAQLASPQLVVRFIAAKDDRVIAHGMILTPLIIGIFAICVFSIGPFGWLIIPKYTSVKPFLKNVDLVVPFIAMKLFPTGINALLLTAIVAAAMSTINSLVHVVSTAFVRDILQNVKTIKEETALRITRISVFLFTLIPLVAAINPPGVIVEIVGVSFSVITAAFLVPLVSALYFKRPNPVAASASMVIAVIVCVLWHLFFYKVYWIYPVVPGLIASITAYIALSLALPSPTEHVA